MKSAVLALAAALAAGPALAEGDPGAGDAEAGKQVVHRKCRACHSIISGDETILAGGKIGPNLWGVVGRRAGTLEGFNYGASTAAAGEEGLVWDQDRLVKYLAGPKEFLRNYLDQDDARSKMVFQLRKADEREDAAAYLATLGEDGGA